MQRVTREQLAVAFDRRLEPVATVKPGERFIVETEDARGGATRTPETCTTEAILEMAGKGGTAIP